MKSTATIRKEHRHEAENRFLIGQAFQKLVLPVGGMCAARIEIAELQDQEEKLAADASLAAHAAALTSHRLCLLLFFVVLLVLLIGERIFVMPALIEAIGASSGDFGSTYMFRAVGSAVLLAAITMGVLVLKFALPPLSASLRDAFDIEVADPGNPHEVDAAFQRLRIARRHAVVNVVAISIYLFAVGWIMAHNLSAGRLFLDRLEALDAAKSQARAATNPGEALFGEPPVAVAGGSTPALQMAPRKNPQSAVLGILLLLHGALLFIPLDFKAAAKSQQALASQGVSGTSAALLRRRIRLRRRLFKRISAVDKILAKYGSTPETEKLLRGRMEEIASQFETFLPFPSVTTDEVAIHDAAWVEAEGASVPDRHSPAA